ncbi:porin PorA family protein [Blastococcus goldschmidtiae]|uniref:Porin PorA family protein n=1 Tax=Blastococcus goldschmidtiae TaxID=3075546 RepID=A0ABU2K5G6_9ACTN|nr:porin PorA family protein [Blastococcus sp. DSM 46792]MDT0275428.1 porin PorA family protein [Blastococcus sp. DSM 46792]
MRLTRSSVVLAVIGVLLIVAAAVVRFVVVPSVTELPTDLDVTLEFEGTYNGINPGVINGSSTEVLSEDVPIQATRQVLGESVDGDTEIVLRRDERTIGDRRPQVTEVRFAVDRETFEAVAAPGDAEDVTSAEGLVFSLPVDPSTEEGAYGYWDQYTMQAAPLTFEGEDTLGGREVYRYESVAEGELADPPSLGLPSFLPKAQLAALAPGLEGLVAPELLAALPGVLPSLPTSIPIEWTSKTTTLVVADQELGATVAGGSTQEITGSLDLGVTTVDVPFATIAIESTDDSIETRGDQVADDSQLLKLVGTVLPIVALVVGVLLLVAALLLARRAAARAAAPVETGSHSSV